MPKSNKINSKNDNPAGRIIDLFEKFMTIELYLKTDLGHHSIARRLGMGTQRVTSILKGVKKIKK